MAMMEENDEELKKALLLSLQESYVPSLRASRTSSFNHSNLYGDYGSEEEALKQVQFLSAIEAAENEPSNVEEFIGSSSRQTLLNSTSRNIPPPEAIPEPLMDFEAWKSKSAAERASEIFGNNMDNMENNKPDINPRREEVLLAKHQEARQPLKIQNRQNEHRNNTLPVGAFNSKGSKDGRPKSDTQLEKLIPIPAQPPVHNTASGLNNHTNCKQLSEEDQLKLVLQLSKLETKMDFESKTKLAVEESNNNLMVNRFDWISDDENVGMTEVRRKRRQRSTSSSSTPSSGTTPPSSSVPTTSSSMIIPISTYTPEEFKIIPGSRRLIVVDGNNVGWAHSGHKSFSLKGVTICVDFFTRKEHKVVVFLPRGAYNYATEEEKETLDIMELEQILSYCPPKTYDDLFSIKYAASRKGIVVSNDQFKDVKAKNIPDYTDQVVNRRLGFSWLGDTIMVPDDPLGRDGPSLEQFLKHPLK